MKLQSVTVVVLLLNALCARAAETTLTPAQQLVHDIYAEIIAIDTTHSTGSTTRAADAIAKRLIAAGFPAAEIHRLGPTPTKGNLVVRLHGAADKKPLLLLAHLDVVEAKREDWTVDPFTLLERDGFFYGRGTLDDKAMAAIFTLEMIRMKRDGITPNRDVILALTADEESGPDDGADWLLRNHRDLVDAGIVLNEGGGGRIRNGKYQLNGVQASEKSYMNFQLEVRDKGGHSSLPTKENAIYRLAHGLTRLEQYEFPVELNEVTRDYLAHNAQIESGQTAADMAALAKDPSDVQAAARLSETPTYNAILRTTCVATRLEGGHADNALPQMARATVNCRVLPGHSLEEVQKTLTEVVADGQIAITPTDTGAPGPASPLDPELMGAVEKITTELWPGVPAVPMMSSGASDSRYFRAAGIPAYGVSGLFVDMDDVRAHGKDERLGVRQFYEGAEFLHRLIRALVSKE